MFIQIEETPNPDALKFLPGQEILPEGSMEFKSEEEASVSPLATCLLKIVGVQSVFLGTDFISITKESKKDWFVLKPLVLSTLMEALTTKIPVLDENAKPQTSGATNKVQADDSEIVAQIKELLETRVAPAVAQDGGEIVFHDFDEGIVYLEMRGACSGCPSSTMTLKAGIENMLRYYVPEVQEVRPVQI